LIEENAMNLFHEFSNKAPNRVFLSVVLGALAGVSYAILIPLVLMALHVAPKGLTYVPDEVHTFFSYEVSNFKYARLFFVLCLFILVARSISQINLIRLSMDLTTDLRTKLYEKIVHAPVMALEKVGPSRLNGVVTEDVRRVILGARLLPDLLINAVTLVGMLGFLMYLNRSTFLFVMGAIAVGIITYQIPMYISNRGFARSRRLFDGLNEAIRGLIYGVKELKLDAVKRRNYFERVLLDREHALLKTDKYAFSVLATATSYGDLISFFVVGVVAFIFSNYQAMSSEELIGVIMALLYVTGPVAVVLNAVPQIAMAKVSLRNIAQLLQEIPEEPSITPSAILEPWDRIILSDICYQHTTTGGQDGFKVGPINLEIERGKVTFIIGGNGSGKSTLSKLLSMHYSPASGSIRFGDQKVEPDTVANFRQEIAAIFSDYYLFDRLLCDISEETLASADSYRKEFGIAEKVQINGGRFSTLSLSDGQRKRLALLIAFLENKNIYLFDEWAADQDPVFKDIFYRKILVDLKQKGKAVIVISHDDRYFHMADRIVTMESGKVVSISDHQADSPFWRNALGEQGVVAASQAENPTAAMAPVNRTISH
jgi:putative ATP-binding cassette transporter